MILTALLAPFTVGTLLIAGRGRLTGVWAASLGLAAMLVSTISLVVVWVDDSAATFAGEIDHAWIELLGARFHLGLDAVSWPLALMAAVLGTLCCVWMLTRQASAALVGLALIITASSIGVFASLDLLLFFVFFELALIPMWFVIAWWGDGDDPNGRRRAATRFLLFTVAGSALVLVGIVIVGLETGSLQINEVMAGLDTGNATLVTAAALMAVGFAVKTPIVPLHTWLPDAHSKAPTVGSVLLAAVFLKLGTYGLIRLCVQMLPESAAEVAPWLAIAGVVGIVWSALACYAQDDLKRLIAYSSIGHMGFVVLALSTMSQIGIAAAVFGSVAHGLITGLLFFTAGSLKDRFGTASMAGIGRGLYERMPWLAVAFVFAAVASLGLPGLAGFWGELLSLRAAYEVGEVLSQPLAWTLLVVAALGVALTTAYFIRAIRLIAQGEPTPHKADGALAVREKVVMSLLAASIVALGVAPGLLVGLFDTGVAG